MDVRGRLWRKLSTEELMLLSCGVGEDSWESLDCKEIQPVHSKGDQPWVFFGRNDAKAETPVLWPAHAKSWLIERLWCWEGLGAGGAGDDRGWDGWMASLTRWTRVWVNSGSWWWTGRPGVLRFIESWRVGHDWTTELNWTELKAFDKADHNKLWKILEEIGIPDHLTCLLRNLYAGQEETVRSTQGTTDWFQNGKGVHQGCILSPCLFNLYVDYIMWYVGWMKHKLESRMPQEISTSICRWHHPMA